MMIKLNYFEEGKADPFDLQLKIAIGQGYVPSGCLLSGVSVMCLVSSGKDPCAGCWADRKICGGRSRKKKEV